MTRVLNPIVSESYMKGYIKDEGLIKPEGKITITENGTDIDVAQFRAADVSVSGGGGDSPIVYIKVNITNVDANIDLYDYDNSNSNAALVNYFTNEDSGQVHPYFKTINSMVGSVEGTGSLIASKNGGTGESYLIPVLTSVYKDGEWVPSKTFKIDKTRATALTEVSNVTITEDEYFYIFKLTDPDTSGEINISLLGYIPD